MEEESHKFVFTREKVAEILAQYLENTSDHALIANPRIIVVFDDIILVSDVVE